MNRPWTTPFRLATVLVMATVLAACGGEEATETIPVAVPESTPASTTATTTEVPATTSSLASSTTTPDEIVETTAAIAPLRDLAYEPFLMGLDFPIVAMPQAPDSDNLLVALKDGVVLEATPAGETRTVLDISDRVENLGERGFLGMAVHPDDPTRFFAHFSDRSTTTVSEFAVAEEGTIDPGSEQVLFTTSQPAGNHNGGWIQFGGDGMLYLGLGDGGGSDDQFGNGQKDNTPLAGLVRIDVDTGEAEKFAKGLRNPWRFWIEGDLVYIADVGQNAYEEVSVGPMQPGVNYGWSIMEGFHCFASTADCDQTGLQLPVVEVEHGDAGTCSITGGVVYRGADIPELSGHYFYSDYCGGWLRSFRYDDGEAVEQSDWTDSVGTPGQIVSFGYGPRGQVYVLTTSDVLEITAVR
jgi:glucose/arabinose dehydrogenase